MARAKNFKIAIIGGGIAGLTMAIALHKRDIQVTIYEQASRFGEVGAGVGFNADAVQAMRICDKSIYDAFELVQTYNMWPSKRKTQEPVFSISSQNGYCGAHRAAFLDEMVKLVPKDIAEFGKRLDKISEISDGEMVMTFQDGSTATADAIIGCDGIKSRVRQLIIGEHHPSAYPTYTHKYAYRGLIPMEKAVEVVGEERAQNATLRMGLDGYILTYPVNHGNTVNLVTYHTDDNDWPDYNKLIRPATREDVLWDFQYFDSEAVELLKMIQPDLDCWAVFDLGHPVPAYCKGRICITGDAAHATSPHHGAGAGFAIEDSAVLSELLVDKNVHSSRDLEAVFATFDSCRRARTQWLVESSRFGGEMYTWNCEAVGRDFRTMEAEINARINNIDQVDVKEMCEEAKETLAKTLGV